MLIRVWPWVQGKCSRRRIKENSNGQTYPGFLRCSLLCRSYLCGRHEHFNLHSSCAEVPYTITVCFGWISWQNHTDVLYEASWVYRSFYMYRQSGDVEYTLNYRIDQIQALLKDEIDAKNWICILSWPVINLLACRSKPYCPAYSSW